jgi:hypothetical protein
MKPNSHPVDPKVWWENEPDKQNAPPLGGAQGFK